MRATFLVALVDAVGIGAGLAIMGVPLALPLASLVFLGAFILVGAVVTGSSRWRWRCWPAGSSTR